MQTKAVPGPTGQKCGYDLENMWAGYEKYTHMRQKPYGPHIVAQMSPMRGPWFCASWVHLKIIF